jgi:hypothetical protein
MVFLRVQSNNFSLYAGVLGLVLVVGCGHSKPDARRTVASSAQDASQDEQFHDFGLVKPGEVRSHSFQLKNTTNEPLVFDSFRSSCNCTNLKVSKKRIDPGEPFQISVTFHAAKKNYDALSNIVAQFRNSNTWNVPLRLVAKVRQPLSLNSSSLSWTSVGVRDLPIATFLVRNYSDATWRGLSFTPSKDWLEIRSEPVAPDEGARQMWKCSAELLPTHLGYGTHSASVTIRAKDAEESAVLPIKIDIDAPVVLVPNRVFFAPQDIDRSSTVDLSLVFRTPDRPESQEGFEVQSSLQDVLQTELVKSKDGNWLLRCRCNPGGQAIRDEFQLKIPSLQTTMVVPVFIAARTANAVSP